jgi:deoxyribodipyrimidine photo-lyase
MKKPVSIFWFRRDLRLEDNAGLYKAEQGEHPVQCIFIFDTHILEKLDNKQDARVDFIHQELTRLDQELRIYGSSLRIYIGKPEVVWIQILEEFNVQQAFCNRDYEPYARTRDEAIFKLLKEQNIALTGSKDHVIFEKNEVLKDDGKPYTVFTPYMNKWKKSLKADSFTSFDSIRLSNNFNKCTGNVLPTLEDIGFRKTNIQIPSRKVVLAVIKNYHETRDTPSVQGTSRLSVHLRFGTVSIRQLAATGQKLNEKWLNELIWRDFYQMIIYHFPESVNHAFKAAYDRIPWINNENQFKAWCEGKTGYPIVDAGMRELNATGFMHNRVRMIVASFLTKHLLIDWRWGERYFASKLLDFDLASNVGGWQWAASSGCDAAPYFRVFNPEAQQQKFDTQMKYIRQWAPEYLLNPASAPKPIVNHAFARNRVLETYKQALS